ncbi:MAG: hypothetical protein ACREQN_12565 [Candidatus Binataceae bacterium]
MTKLTAETAKRMALELYDYQLSDDAAAAVAHMVGAMATYSQRLEALNLAGIQPPLGYSTLQAEADRLRRRSS